MIILLIISLDSKFTVFETGFGKQVNNAISLTWFSNVAVVRSKSSDHWFSVPTSLKTLSHTSEVGVFFL